MQALLLMLCTLGVSTPSSEAARAAARRVAEGREDAGRALQALMRMGRFGLDELVRTGRSAEGADRRRVYEALGAFRGETAFSALLEGLRTSDRDAQLGAARGLARLGGPEAVEPLVQTAMTPDPEVRRAIVDGLVKLGKLSEGPVEALVGHPSPYARETALRVRAGLHSGDRRRRAILDGFRDPEANVRAAAIELADLWRDMSLARALVKLSRDGDPEVAARAVEAVARFPALRKELPSLLSDPRVTEQAWMTAFHRMRDYDDMAIPYLIAAIAQAGGKRQNVMLDLLVSDASEKELAAFVRLLDSNQVDHAQVIKDLLGRMGARADTAAARMILDQRASLVAAIHAYLSTRPRHGITDEILSSAKEGPLEDRARHIEIIAELDPKAVREDLVDLLDDTAKEVRVAAAKALGGIHDASAEAELVRLLDDPKKEVRIEAVRGLKAYRSRLSVLARMSAMEDPDPDVRTAAMQSFEGSNADKVLEALERVVRTGSHPERLAALTAIAEIKTTRAAVLLVELVTNEEDGIREAASAYFDSLPALTPGLEALGQ